MLTGELPIGRFAPPSQKAPVDARVDDVVFHALEKEREKRFRSANEVKTSVEAIAGHPGAPQGAPRPAPTVVLPVRRANCYFSTPRRMRNCFPGPQAHIFQCKGELRLEVESLVFISPWQTRVVIPLREIRDLSVGQFQMWTTPWVMKYERINFLAVTFGPGDQHRTVLLTPIPPAAASPAQINAEVADWFNAVGKAVVDLTGRAPHAWEPGAVRISAQPSWNRKGIPLALAPLAAWIVGILNMRSPDSSSSAPIWAAAFVLTVLLCSALVWFSVGFLKANHALKSGNLDAVTSDEPPGGPASNVSAATIPPTEPQGKKPRMPFWWTISACIFLAIGILAVIDTLASVYSRPMNPTLYPGVVHLFAGIALLTRSRRWRLVALWTLGLALAAGAFVTIMMAIVPQHGTVRFPALNLSIPVAEQPRWAAAAAVFLALVLGWPAYLLMSAKAKALFGLAKPK